MARTTIRDRYQKIIGYIEDMATPGEQRALNAKLTIVGYYSARDDYTRDHTLKIIGTGNQLMGLITRAG